MNRLLLMTVALCFASTMFAQQADHHHNGLEFGISAAYVHLDAEDEDAAGLHLHLLKKLGHHGIAGYFGVGLGYENIFAEHEHHTVMATLAVYPWQNLVIAISPGVIFTEHDGEWEDEYTTHIEASYGFMVGDMEIGPVIGFAESEDDKHYMAGMHLGIGL